MERLALISDIHANIAALDAVLSDINSLGCSNIVCCGDLVGYGPRPNEVIERIHELSIPSVMGNYDEAVGFLLLACGCNIDSPKQKMLSNNSLKWTIANTNESNRKLLRELPERLDMFFGAKSAIIVHSSLDSMTEYIYETASERICEILDSIEQDIYIFGHTHFPFIKTIGNKVIINAGSVGRPKNCDNRASYILLEIDNYEILGSIRKVSYDVEKVAKEIEHSGLDSYFAEYIRNGGDKDEVFRIKDNYSCDIDINPNTRKGI